MILLHTSEEEITKVGFMPKMGVGVEGAGKEVLRGVYDEIYKVRRLLRKDDVVRYYCISERGRTCFGTLF